MKLPIVGPTYRSLSQTADAAQCVNWFVETLQDANAKADAVLYPTPGFTALLVLAPGPIRGLYETYNGRVFVVSGSVLYETTTGVGVVRGALALDTYPATICGNGAAGGQMFITSGDVGYCYDLATDTLTTELASGAAMGVYLTNRFIALNRALSLIRISDLDDGTRWDPTQFAQRSLAADPWVSIVVVNSELWLIGSQTSEVWTDQGLFPFPYAPIPGAFLNTGTRAPFSASVANGVLAWVGQESDGDGVIVRANGYAAERISTHPVEFAIQQYADLSDAVSFAYQEHGHAFWVCNFVSGGRSWVWDSVTNLWHERGFWNAATAQYEALRVCVHIQTGSVMHLVGDRATGQIYTMDATIPTDVDGSGIVRDRIFRGIDDEQQLVSYPWLQIEFQPGVGTATGQGADPQAMLRFSKDNGRTWGPERWTSIGKIGEYVRRAIWRRIGQARNGTFWLRVSDPSTPLAVIQAIVRPSGGLS